MCRFKPTKFHVVVGGKVTPRERFRDVSALLCRWIAGFYGRSAALICCVGQGRDSRSGVRVRGASVSLVVAAGPHECLRDRKLRHLVQTIVGFHRRCAAVVVLRWSGTAGLLAAEFWIAEHEAPCTCVYTCAEVV